MTSRQGPEFNDVQRPAFEILRDQFGYVYLPAEALEAERSNESDVILTKRLGERLKVIHPGLTDNGVRQAIEARVARPSHGRVPKAQEAAPFGLDRFQTIPIRKPSGETGTLQRLWPDGAASCRYATRPCDGRASRVSERSKTVGLDGMWSQFRK